MKETEWTNIICARLRENHGALTRSLDGGTFGANGWPDRIIVLRERTFFVEFKGPETKVENLQLAMLTKLEKRLPGFVFICRKNKGNSGGKFYSPTYKEPMAEFDSPVNVLSALNYASELALRLIQESEASAVGLLSSGEKQSTQTSQ